MGGQVVRRVEVGVREDRETGKGDGWGGQLVGQVRE